MTRRPIRLTDRGHTAVLFAAFLLALALASAAEWIIR